MLALFTVSCATKEAQVSEDISQIEATVSYTAGESGTSLTALVTMPMGKCTECSACGASGTWVNDGTGCTPITHYRECSIEQ